MQDDPEQRQNVIEVHTGERQIAVTRSVVPEGKEYSAYKSFLRNDFFYTCAYCGMSEAEAQAIRFTIDHYEPRRARPELEHVYGNLMYCCEECNLRKSDRIPSEKARQRGISFFRPDRDFREDHFELSGVRVEARTELGNYNIETIDLNRLSLRRLRDIRRRIANCEKFVAEGILGLRHFPLDQLPKHIKGHALRSINQAETIGGDIVDSIENLLKAAAQSPLTVPDGEDEKANAKNRLEKIKRFEALYPGTWRARYEERKD